MQKLLQEALTSGLLTSCGTESDPPQKSPVKQPNKKPRIEQGDSDTRVQFNRIVLDEDQLCDEKWLNDKHINYA